MRRTAIRLGIAALTFAVGLVIASPSRFAPQLKAISGEPGVEAPPPTALDQAAAEVYPEAVTTGDFDQFWSEFTSAVAGDDKEKLYTLVHGNGFTWEPGSLKLERKLSPEISNSYVVKSYDEFDKNYSEMFPAFIKRAILTRQPDGGLGVVGYKEIRWVEKRDRRFRSGEFTLTFSNIEGKGYKFTGAFMGPSY